MKKLLSFLAVHATVIAFGQTATDSVNTSLGDFVLVTTESVHESEIAIEEPITTSDGGTGDFVAAGSSARFLQPAVVTSEINIQAVPNPASGVTELKVTGMTGVATILVTNVLGQTVYSSSINIDPTKQIFLPAQLWQSGTYLIVVNAGSEVKTERLIVE